jgi:hypothetical protein
MIEEADQWPLVPIGPNVQSYRRAVCRVRDS